MYAYKGMHGEDVHFSMTGSEYMQIFLERLWRSAEIGGWYSSWYIEQRDLYIYIHKLYQSSEIFNVRVLKNDLIFHIFLRFSFHFLSDYFVIKLYRKCADTCEYGEHTVTYSL